MNVSPANSVQTLPPSAVKYSSVGLERWRSSSGWHLLAVVDEHLSVVMLMSVFKVTLLSQYSPICLLCGKSKTFLTSHLAPFYNVPRLSAAFGSLREEYCKKTLNILALPKIQNVASHI